VIATSAVIATSFTLAQAPRQRDLTLTPEARKEVIDGAIRHLNEAYVFPETAKKMEEALLSRAKAGDYNSITSGVALAQLLTTHLQEVSKDKHLRVQFSPQPIPVQSNNEPSAEEILRARTMMARQNFGVDKIERLQGNVGYLELRGFHRLEWAKDTLAAAMNVLANSDAVIIDLRRNGGGSPETVAFVSSYLFGSEPVHLNSLYFRPTNQTEKFYTLRDVPGKRLEGKDVYLLTSSYTFSGAEEFAYNLKNLKRATIIGETTGGGAHPGGPRRINDHFAIWTPTGRAINPITNDNWEGKGVEPDVKTSAADALRTAHLLILKKTAAAETDEGRKEVLRAEIQRLEKGS
jgi:C-terminal processing protease CtpA/Prc